MDIYRVSQRSRVSIDYYCEAVGKSKGDSQVCILFILVWLVFGIPLSAAELGEAEWIKNRYCDFVGSDLPALRELEQISQTVVIGCSDFAEWPEEFPQRVLVQVLPEGIPHVIRGKTSGVTINLIQGAPREENAEWLTRGLLSRYGLWRGNSTPPPLWLVNATVISGSIQRRPKLRTVLIRRLEDEKLPSLTQRIKMVDRTTDKGWDYLVYLFLESGELTKSNFSQLLEQFWENGYDWTQLALFFTSRYSELNGAELELLWQTFVTEMLASENSVCLSEQESQSALESLSKLEVLNNQQPEILTPDTWYLYRSNELVVGSFARKKCELEVLAVSIHPYYFNACHSMNQVLLALDAGDLKSYREATNRWKQDMLDAQQLTFETDRLLGRMCE